MPPLAARQRVRQPGTITTSRETRQRGQLIDSHQTNEKVPVETNLPHPAYVTVKGGVTINMDNFESVRVDVAVSIPCAPDDASLEECYQHCSKFVDEKIGLERDLAMGTSGAQEGVTA